ncbi:zinc ribbon domain-containing protein [Brevibacterium album]|uniref:zinc ribbon domain-containing protein n=1 Tax=Brevibacterium album TaxID=417948 RepID=UPI00041AB10C|nr:hypothetical protein [Brevibacterium album]
MAEHTLDETQTQALLAWIGLAADRRSRAHEALQTERLERLRALAAEHGSLSSRCEELERERTEHETRADELEQQADALRTRIGRTEERLNAGVGLTSRDLLGLQDEIAGLRVRVEEIETSQVEELESAEVAAEALATTRARADQVASRGRDLQAERASEGARLSGEIEALDARLREQEALLPQTVRARLTLEGEYPAAATVEGGACGACGAQLSGTSADAYRNATAGACLECEDCGALLLRAGG